MSIALYRERGSLPVDYSAFAEAYDLLNRVASVGADHWWRRVTAQLVLAQQPARILDVATGTGKQIQALLEEKRSKPASRKIQIVGIDINRKMLEIACHRVGTLPYVRLLEASVYQIPFPDQYFDAVTIAFGIRNFLDPERALAECFRVLQPGGRLYILDFFDWKDFPGLPYRMILFTLLPLQGIVFTGRWKDYLMLVLSGGYYSRRRLISTGKKTGLLLRRIFPLSWGVSQVIILERPE